MVGSPEPVVRNGSALLPGWSLSCNRCGTRQRPDAFARGCPVCEARGKPFPLVVAYDDGTSIAGNERPGGGVWAHHERLPAIAPALRLTLGEGNTPLIQVPAVAELTGHDRIYLKLEQGNPTAAHKDRFHAVSVAVGRALGYTGVVSMSTGNHGLSMTAYAGLHGMRAVVVGNQRMPPLIQRAIRFAGGLPLLMPPDSGFSLLMQLVEEGWYPSTASWDIPVANPFGVEGYKTIGYELYRQLGDRMPDLAFFPAAAGDGIVGLHRAIGDLRQLGFAHVDSRLCACQPATAAPLVRALDLGLPEVEEIPGAWSRALSIGDPISGILALNAVRATGGFGVAITDDAIMAAGRLLATNGLLVEPSSAASVAGAIQAIQERPELREQTIVCVITSSGLKWLDDYADDGDLPGGVAVGSAEDALAEIGRFAAA